MKKWISSFLITVSCLVGLLFLTVFNYTADYRDWQNSDTWHTVTSDAFTVSPKTSTVLYTYTINGQSYESTRSHFFIIQNQDSRWSPWMIDHLDTAVVTVYYDPNDASWAVLVPETDILAVYQLPLTILVCFMIISFPLLTWGGFMWWFRRKL
jgi:hypothetical protein